MKCKCKLCNYEWESRVEHPRVCSRCKRHEWNVDLKQTSKTCDKILNSINKNLAGGSK